MDQNRGKRDMVVEDAEGLEEDCRYRRHASKKLKLTPPPVIEDDAPEDPIPMMPPKVSRHHLTDDRSPFKQNPNMSKGDEFWSTNGLGFPRGGAAGRGRTGVLMPPTASATGYHSSSYTSSSSSNATRTFRSTTPIMQNTSSSSSMIISYHEDAETFPSSIASPTLQTIERYAPSSSTVRSLFQNNTREWGSPYSHGSGMMEED